MKADYILKSSRIYKGTGTRQCEGIVAIQGQKIIFAGPADKAERFMGPDTVERDFGDQLILPGFHDAHMHMYMSSLYASPLIHVSFTDTSEEECVAGLAEHA